MERVKYDSIVQEALDKVRGEIDSTKSTHLALISLTLIYIEKTKSDENVDAVTWSSATQNGYNIAETLQKAAIETEERIPSLKGALTFVDFTGISDATLFNFVSTLNKYSLPDAETLSTTFENLLYHYMDSQGKVGGEHISPQSINTLLPRLLDIKQGSIYDGTAGTALLLTESEKLNEEKSDGLSFYAQDVSEEASFIGKLNLFIHGITDFNYQTGDTLVDPAFIEENGLMKFDHVMMNFPFSMSWDKSKVENELFGRFIYGLPSNSNADMAFISHAIASLKATGRAALIVTHGVLFRAGSERKIREEIIQSDLIEGVIGLPSNLFVSMGIPVAILLINKSKPTDRKGKIFFINAAEDYQRGRGHNQLREQDIEKIVDTFKEGNEIPSYSRFVDIEEIDAGSLSIPKYFDVDDVDSPIGTVTVNRKKFEEHHSESSPLGDITKIYRGINTPAKSQQKEAATTYKVIQLTDVQEGIIQTETLQSMPIKDRNKAKQYLVKEGDIIISSRGTAIKIAIVPSLDEEIILSHNFIGLRPHKHIYASYLKAYLQSPIGQYYLTSLQKGSAVKVLSLKEIADVMVPDLAYERQKQIGDAFEEADRDYKNALREAEEQKILRYKNLYSEMEIDVALEVPGQK